MSVIFKKGQEAPYIQIMEISQEKLHENNKRQDSILYVILQVKD